MKITISRLEQIILEESKALLKDCETLLTLTESGPKFPIKLPGGTGFLARTLQNLKSLGSSSGVTFAKVIDTIRQLPQNVRGGLIKKYGSAEDIANWAWRKKFKTPATDAEQRAARGAIPGFAAHGRKSVGLNVYAPKEITPEIFDEYMKVYSDTLEQSTNPNSADSFARYTAFTDVLKGKNLTPSSLKFMESIAQNMAQLRYDDPALFAQIRGPGKTGQWGVQLDPDTGRFYKVPVLFVGGKGEVRELPKAPPTREWDIEQQKWVPIERRVESPVKLEIIPGGKEAKTPPAGKLEPVKSTEEKD